MTSGDVAALFGAVKVRTAHARISDWTDPQATLEAVKRGPYAGSLDDPGTLGLPDTPTAIELRQWLDLEAGRAREERGQLVVVKDGPRWWRVVPGLEPAAGVEPASSIELADALRRWTDPQPLARMMELSAGDTTTVLGREALVVHATARGEAGYAGELAPLGWGASRWELLVDASRGVLLGTTAFVDDTPFRRVEALELVLDEPLDPSLFAPLS